MKTVGLVYSDGDTHRSTERFLSKDELRGAFPEAEYVTLSIQYRRRKFKKKSGSESGLKKGMNKRNRKRSYGQSSREKISFGHRIIWLG